MFRVLVIAAVAGCAGAEAMAVVSPAAPAAPLRSEGIGVTPGETMAFEIRFGAMVAGEVQLAVGEPGTLAGQRAVVVTSSAETTGALRLVRPLTDHATTTIDMATGRPMALETRVAEGDTTTVAQATFTTTSANVEIRRNADPKPRSYHIEFGDRSVHDTHSAMAQLRSWRATPGEARTVYVVSGRKLWRIDVRMVGTETIGSPLGNRSAAKFSGAAYRTQPTLKPETTKPTRTFEVWLSEDADRVPLKVSATTELGDIEMVLTDYNRP